MRKMASDPYNLRKLADRDLFKWIGGWRQGTERHVAGIEELKRRNSAPADLRSWIALGISLAACLIALAAFLYTVFKG